MLKAIVFLISSLKKEQRRDSGGMLNAKEASNESAIR